MTREHLGRLMASNKLSDSDKQVITCQYWRVLNPGNFIQKLMELLYACDEDNLLRMRLSFPNQVDSVQKWKDGTTGRIIDEILREELEVSAG